MTNYLIDSENTGIAWISFLCDKIKKTDRIFLFYTKNSPKIPYEYLQMLSLIIQQINAIPCFCGNPNALDFQLSSYIGYLIKTGKKSTYCIVSNDKGYDTVVAFWERQGIKIHRADITTSKKTENVTTLEIKESDSFPNLIGVLGINGTDYEKFRSKISKARDLASAYHIFVCYFGQKKGTDYYSKAKKILKKYYR